MLDFLFDYLNNRREMAQVSSKPLKKEINEQVFELLLRIFTQTYSRKKAIEFLDDLLSPTEKVVLAKRLAIALLLEKGYGYEEVERILHVSMSTIASVNIKLKHKGEGYRYFVSRALKEEKVKKLWEKLEDLVLDMGSIGGKGSSGWGQPRRGVHKKRWEKSTPISD